VPLRICIIGKYPPIQGGVSARTYRTAHALAARGHEVHVVTNAREVAPPFRIHMRPQDWQRCEARDGSGSVRLHWTDPVDRSQAYIPMASPFVSKLATVAASIHAASPFDVIFSHYLEPYGVAGHLAAQMTGVPHVVRMAGSDAGRLWHHPQLELLYDHVLRAADFVVAVGRVADRAAQRGVRPERIVAGGAYSIAEDFSPEGPVLDLDALRMEVAENSELQDMVWGNFSGKRPYFGVYGKLGDNKGSFALLEAMQRLKQAGLDVGLVALAHGRPQIEGRFRTRVTELGLSDRVLQIPFLPHWRVPEFLRGCLAVCCLEQDFPIAAHSPIVPLEVLHSGSCLVASTEMIRKLPQWQRLPHGYGCVAVNDVNDVMELSGKLAAIVRQPELAATVGARGRSFAMACQGDVEFPDKLERTLEAAAQHRTLPPAPKHDIGDDTANMFPLTQIAAARLGLKGLRDRAGGLEHARQILTGLKKAATAGQSDLQPFASAVEAEIAVADAMTEIASHGASADSLFRVDMDTWALDCRSLGNLLPVRDAKLRILRFEHDLSVLQGVVTADEFPTRLDPGPSYMVVAGSEPFLVDRFTARFLELSNGTQTVEQIIDLIEHEFGYAAEASRLAWIEELLVSGLIGVRASKKSGAQAPAGIKAE
jgi:glycosyltransferase involved in cell wall biosynthesis